MGLPSAAVCDLQRRHQHDAIPVLGKPHDFSKWGSGRNSLYLRLWRPDGAWLPKGQRHVQSMQWQRCTRLVSGIRHRPCEPAAGSAKGFIERFQVSMKQIFADRHGPSCSGWPTCITQLGQAGPGASMNCVLTDIPILISAGQYAWMGSPKQCWLGWACSWQVSAARWRLGCACIWQVL